MAYGSALAVLADPTRRKVFERLRAGPRPVNLIAAGLPVSRPAVSQHLKALKDAGLVEERSEGVRRPDGTARVAGQFLGRCAGGLQT
jgi:DNA-binding transcriptional ArsR family regulator